MKRALEQIHAKVRGRVQGVGFRQFTWKTAAQMQITGWVRNDPDGSVEVFAQGEKDKIEAFLSLLKKGPRHAQVEAVDVSERHAIDAFSSTHFEVRN